MIPNNFFLGGGAGETQMGVVGAAMMLIAVVLMFALPRKYVVVPVLLAVFLVPRGEVVVLGGTHLMPARIIALFGLAKLMWLRHATPGTVFAGGLNPIDKAFLWCSLAHSVSFVLLWREFGAVANQLGFLLGELGLYVLLRFLIRDEKDVYRVLKVFVIIAAINTCGMVFERLWVKNLFGLLIGGVDPVPLIRDGRIRSQGAFGHAILAGTYGAMLLPLFVLLWTHGKARVFAAVGVISSMVMVLTSASSTPVMATLGVVLTICFWPIRKGMRVVRWAIVLILISLQLVMKVPVWFLIARIDLAGGSASYDRANLIDVFVRHFFDWWLIGTRDIGSWGWSMWDLSNAYICQGESGGLIAFIFFIAVISRAFSLIGKTRKLAKGAKQEWLLWLFGAALFANVMAFFGVSYWDQTAVAWFALLAMIPVMTAAVAKAKKGQMEIRSAVEPEWALASSVTARGDRQQANSIAGVSNFWSATSSDE
jgi:hypothetical protein